ncbi:MAG: hypothetical protein QM817_40405 [Archangium sp.]
MMNRLLALALTCFALQASADDAPPGACSGSAVGDACTMDDGTPGACIEQHHEYLDPNGVKQTFTEVVCAPKVSAVQRSLLPWLGAGLAFLALCAALYSRPRATVPGHRGDQRGVGVG